MIFRLHSTLPGGVLDYHGDEEGEDYNNKEEEEEEEEREKRKRSNHHLPVP